MFVMVACMLLPRFQLTVAVWRSIPSYCRSRWRWPQNRDPPAPPPPTPSRLARSPTRRPSRSGSSRGCVWARRSPAVPSSRWYHPIRRAWPTSGSGCSSVWKAIGAAVEPERPGLVCFDVRGLLRLHGGGLEGVLGRGAAEPAGAGSGYGVAPSRFAAVAAASRARVRRPVIVSGARRAGWPRFLAPLPVALLRARPALAELPGGARAARHRHPG